MKAGKYGVKLIVILILLILFAIPLRMVRQIVRERESRSREATEEVIDSWGGRSTISGPYLLIPVYRFEEIRSVEGKPIQQKIERTALFFPDSLNVDIDAETERRSRGIFSVPVYNASIVLEGSFRLEELSERLSGYTIDEEGIRIGLSLGELGGIRAIDEAMFGDSTLTLEPMGTDIVLRGNRITSPVGLTAKALKGSMPYRFRLRMGGGQSISILPVARQTEVAMHSDWENPSFFGSALPIRHDGGDAEPGFSALWSISHLSRNLPHFGFISDLRSEEIDVEGFGVKFLNPDDPYPKNERSVKYAWLFLIVPFAAFFVFEAVKGEAVHPVQYLLTGCADIVFYLLLLSLSEHIPFFTAYMLAASGGSLLIAAYASAVLGSKKSGITLGGIIVIAYVYLMVVLTSEDYALLLGSIGLFIALALIMFLTRNVSWYDTPLNMEAAGRMVDRGKRRRSTWQNLDGSAPE
ncbi:cell envelope integrity protein CreD [Sediminispirochaeta bajacaliforniensis]|uniref:cell envelope integrity protein CreD n=1 Tax=Sediminispirochaeta bajacaliforniensis TaxID=148 RepID=UPI0003709617|nr:cell envelope integrity protein CreD [Sediminispirochaeta bajacaliforniensis]